MYRGLLRVKGWERMQNKTKKMPQTKKYLYNPL